MDRKKRLTGVVSIVQSGWRLDKALANLFGYSRSCAKVWVLEGCVRINNQFVNQPKKRVIIGENIQVYLDVKLNIFPKPQNIFLNVVYEDDDILVINKPCNLVVHPGKGHSEGTVLNGLLYHYPKIADVPRAGIVHRLDKNTTGLMVIAKTLFSQIRLLELFQKRKITREYDAIVVGNLISGQTISQPIRRHRNKRTHMTVDLSFGREAITHYWVVEHFRAYTHLRLRLDTGRTHQIRVHMKHIKHPLLGDQKYGSNFQVPKSGSEKLFSVICGFKRQALHATRLSFCHPVKKNQMEWNSPFPKDMENLIKFLKKDKKEFLENNFLKF